MGTFGGILSTGQQALLAHQTALQVTGQNIANANTPGYSRERAELVSVASSLTNILHSGVNAEEITRAYDRFITTQVTVASSNLKSTQTQSDLLGQVEALFNDLNTPEAGLSGTLDTFFQGWNDLSQNPQSLSERSSVLLQGENVAEAFHRLADGLQGLYQERNAQLGDAVTEVNHLTTQLATLNQQIREREVDPKNHANTLRDQQDLVLKQLAVKINITSFTTDSGQVTVLLGGGRPLVEGVQSFNLATRVDPDDPQRLLVALNDARAMEQT